MSFPPTTAAANTGAFSFGLSTATAGAKPPTLSFGATPPNANAPAKPLSFGTPALPTAANVPQFGTTPTATSAAPTAAALPTLTGFGTTAAAPLSFGAAPAAAPAFGATPAAAPAFGATPAAAPAFGTAPAAAPAFGATPAAGIAFGAATTASAPAFGATAAPAPAFSAATAAATAPTFALGTPTPAATATTKPTIPVLAGFGTTPAATTAATGFSLTKATTAAVAPTLGLGLPTATTAPTSSGFANLSTATKTTDSAAVASSSQMTFNQLEEQINKWTLELEEQEKVFTEQATQINAWDKVLIGNNQKILELNDAVQKVKNDQQMLEQELEFIATQHNELEESIAPLQKEFAKMPQVDIERSQTYLMVENLDTQLKQMSEDLKEIIDNLNESNKGQDNTDPIIQIGKILNAHMSSLQWIETSSASIQNKLDDIDKMHESFKRDSERSFRSAYYN